MDKEGEIRTQHYAFLVGEAKFDQIFSRLKEQGLTQVSIDGKAVMSEMGLGRAKTRQQGS